MKFSKNILGFAFKELMFLAALIALLAAFALPAQAQPGTASGTTANVYQGAPPLRIYWLTNNQIAVGGTNLQLSPSSGLFAITNGSLIIGSAGVSNIYSQPFPIYRGRGFVENLAAYSTNVAPVGVLAVWRFGVVHPTNGIPGAAGNYITNWSLYSTNGFFTAGLNTETNWSLLIPPTTVDNYSLGQLYSVTCTSTTNSLFLDPTNSYIGVMPPNPL